MGEALVLFLAEMGRTDWHGNVYILNLYNQQHHYGRLFSPYGEKSDLEMSARLSNKVFLVDHHAADERCQDIYKLLLKTLPSERHTKKI